KKTIAAIVILFAVWFAWSAWPFLALYDLVRAAQAADVAAIERGVDFPELRRSLSSQIIQAYARVTGKKVDGGGLMIGIRSASVSRLSSGPGSCPAWTCRTRCRIGWRAS